MDSSPRKMEYDVNRPNLITIVLEDSHTGNDETEKNRQNLLSYIEELINAINRIRGPTASVTCQKYDDMLQQSKQFLISRKKFTSEQLQVIRTKLNDIEAKIKTGDKETDKRSISEVSSAVESIDLTEDDDGHDSVTQKNCSLPPNKLPSMPLAHRPRDPRFQPLLQPVVDLDELENSLLKHTSQKENSNGYADQNRHTQKTNNITSPTSYVPAPEERYDAYSNVCEIYAHRENMLNKALSTINPHHFPASIPLSVDVIDRFSQNSKENENIRAWENKCKPAFVPANSPVDLQRIPRVLGNVTSEPVKRVNEQNNPSSIKLSDFLSQQMNPVDTNEHVEPVFSPTFVENTCPQKVPTSNVPTFVHSSIPGTYSERPVEKQTYFSSQSSVPIPVSQPVPVPLLASVSALIPKPTYQEKHFKVSNTPVMNSASRNNSNINKTVSENKPIQEVSTEPKSNIRGKLTQEINVIHRAGDSSKIRGSLKILKQDKAAGNTSSNDVSSPVLQKDTIEVTNAGISPNDPRLRNVASHRDPRTTKINVAPSKSKDDTISPVDESYGENNSKPPGKTTFFRPKNLPAKQNQPLRIGQRHTTRSKNFAVMRRNPLYTNYFNNKKEREMKEHVNINQNMPNNKLRNVYQKERTEFYSPLNDIYPQASISRTRSAYGQEKPIYKIPKKNVFPKELRPPFLNKSKNLNNNRQTQSGLPNDRLLNSKLNSSKVNHTERERDEFHLVNQAERPKILKKNKKKKKKRVIRPSNDEINDMDAAVDSLKAVDFGSKHSVNMDSSARISEVGLSQKSLTDELNEIEKLNETESNNLKSYKNTSDSCKSKESPSLVYSELHDKPPKPEQLKKEDSPKYGAKQISKKLTTCSSATSKSKDESSCEDSDSVKYVQQAPRISRNVSENAKGRPKKNIGAKKFNLKTRINMARDKRNDGDAADAKNTSNNQKTKKFKHTKHLNRSNNDSCFEQEEKTSSQKIPLPCDTEIRDSPKPKSEGFAFKNENEFEQFKSRLVTRVPSLKTIVEDLRENDFFPALILKLDTEKFALAKELFWEFCNHRNSNEHTNPTSRSHSTELSTPEEMPSGGAAEKRGDLTLSRETTDADSSKRAETKTDLCNFHECEIKKSTVSNRKTKTGKLNRELERLHADIDMMKHTKNNILTSTGPRACRLQTPSYSDNYQKVTSFEKSKPSARCRNMSFLSTFSTDTDTDEEVLSGRVKRPKKKGNESQKSTYKVRSVLDSEDDNIENETKSSFRSSSREFREETASKLVEQAKHLKPKPCPRSVKIRRYGAEAMSDYDTRCRSLSVMLNKVNGSDNEVVTAASCEREQNSSSATSDSSFFENNDEADWCIDRTESNTKKTSSPELKSSSASVKPPGNEKITLKLMRRQAHMKLKRYQQGLKLGKRTRKKRKKKLKSSESDISEPEVGTVTKVTRASKPVAEKEIDRKTDERIENLPTRGLLKGASDNITLEIITIGMNKGEVLYSCRRTICDFKVRDVKELAYHLKSSHKTETWDGECRICSINLNKKCDFIDALSHLVNDHMMDSLDQAEQSCKNDVSQTVPSKNEESLAVEMSSPNDIDLEERIASLPERNSLSGDVKTIQIGSMAVTNITGTLLFTCNPGTTCPYDTNDVVMFANHLNFVHKDVEWTGWCHVCEREVKPKVDLVDALIHLVNEHLTFVQPAQAEESVSEDFPARIKEEVPDTALANEQEILDTRENEARTTNAVTGPQPDDVEKPLSPKEIVEPPSPATLCPSVSRIRVRRFDGDRLSGSLSAPVEIPEPAKVTESISAPPQPISATPENENSEKIVPFISEAVTVTRAPEKAKENQNEVCRVNQNIVNRSPEQEANISDVALVNAAKEKDDHVPLKKQNQAAYPRLKVDKISMMRFYKCGALDICSFTTDDPGEFRYHLNNVHRDKKKRNKKMAADSLKCLYCLRVCKTVELLIEHLNKEHRFCCYQCPYCAFRACRPVYIYWHLQNNHPSEEKRIYVADIQNNIELLDTASREKEELDIPTLRCCHGCAYETLSISQFLEHMKRLHSQVPTLQCHLCPHICLKLEDLVRHYNFHYIAEFQCLYCLRGLSTLDAIKSHLLHDHPHLYPRAIQRANTPKEDETDPQKKFIKRIEFDPSIEAFKEYLEVINSSVQNTTSLHRRDDSVTSDANSATGISFLYQDHSYFINKEKNSITNMEVDKSALAASLTASGSENGSNLTSPAELRSSASPPKFELSSVSASYESSAAVHGRPPRRTKIGAGLVMGLDGKDLFVCGMTGCDVAAEDYLSFKDHMRICDNARNTKSPTCVHCNRSFQRNINFFEHILSHGVPRFYCTLCDFKHTISKKVGDHMKIHKIIKTKIIPAMPGRDNKNSDLFLVVPDVGSKSRGPQKLNRVLPPQMASVTANNIFASPVISSPVQVQQVTTVYSAEEVDRLLSTQLFSQPVKCGICQYSSKVRINMRCHMISHDCGLPTNTDIINPVPRMEKTELMFNKMTNHAAYAVKNDRKKNNSFTKIEKPDSEEENTIIPAFVPRLLRFSCGAPGCNYVTQDEKGLKDHFEGLHRDLTCFRCPHCGVPISVGKISSHLRYHKEKLYKCAYCDYVHYKSDGIAKHRTEKHAEKALNVQIIRELEQSEVDKMNKETKYDCGTTRGDKSATSSWKCMLCRSGNSVSQNMVKMHCALSHGIQHKFKCSLCSFSHDNEEEVTSHLKSVHKSISLYVVNVYKEIEELNETLTLVKIPNAITPVTPLLPGAASSTTDFKAPSSMRRDSFKETPVTNTVVNVENEKVNEIFATIKEKNDLCVQPYASSFKCPKCLNFRSSSRGEMQNHIYKELQYIRFVCECCGMELVTEKELENHLLMRDEVHARTNDNIISKMTRDLVLEQKVQESLDYQQFMMKEMASDKKSLHNALNTVNSDKGEIIFVSSDDETSSFTSSRKMSSDSNCSYVCSETEGAAATVRKRNTGPRRKVVNNLRTTSFVETKETSIMPARSSIKSNQPCVETINDLETNECNLIRSAKEANSDLKCPICPFVVSTANRLAKHKKNMHENFACLHCSRFFTGEKSLQRHIEATVLLDNGGLSNEECVPSQTKVVHIICPHCSFRSIGNTYVSYTEVAEHNRKAHPEKANQKDEIEVEVDGGERRKLASFEISRLQVEANRGASKSKNQPNNNVSVSQNRKRRNVAVKSTARIPPSFSNGEPPSKVKIL